ncbi:MAG TPA: knotted carbamoyltransferase YgeW, partial [Rectinema sp.]|nr:knotted carbamoyltransferase YgeW [Rectinema sp.]
MEHHSMSKKDIEKFIDELRTKKISMYQKDFLLTWEKSLPEIQATFLVADILRAMRESNISPKVWDSGIAVSNFRDNSTRTRFS